MIIAAAVHPRHQPRPCLPWPWYCTRGQEQQMHPPFLRSATAILTRLSVQTAPPDPPESRSSRVQILQPPASSLQPSLPITLRARWLRCAPLMNQERHERVGRVRAGGGRWPALFTYGVRSHKSPLVSKISHGSQFYKAATPGALGKPPRSLLRRGWPSLSLSLLRP